MGRPKGSKGKKDVPSEINTERYANTRNEMMGTSKVIRLMKLWKVPAKKEIAREQVIIQTEK